MNRRVDQKLHLARLTLAAIDTHPSAEMALIEAALFHLHVAYRAYLHELLAHFKLAIHVETAQAAANLLQAQQLCSADIDELANMEQIGEWPAQLHRAYIEATDTEVVLKPTLSSDIVLRDVSLQIDRKSLAAWLQQFHVLLQRQRTHAQEW